MVVECTLDNLIFRVEAVTPREFSELVQALEVGETYNASPVYKTSIGKGFSSYHQNANVGQGGGAIHIGWKHNSQRENEASYAMRVEFNPSKQNDYKFDWFWEQFHKLFRKHTKLIQEFDLAFDVETPIQNIAVVSLTGRDRSLFKNTVYYGASGLHGRLKVYDKKKEMQQKQKIEIEQEHLTRIEYTFKLGEPIHYNFLRKMSTSIKDDYTISNFNFDEDDAPLKASLLAIQGGQMELKEFGRRYKVKIKEALANMGQIDLDHGFANAKEDIYNKIYYYVQ